MCNLLMVTSIRLLLFYFVEENYEEFKSNNRVNDKIQKKTKTVYTKTLSRSS